MSPSDYEMIEQGYDPPRMNEGELVYTGPGELAALRTMRAKCEAIARDTIPEIITNDYEDGFAAAAKQIAAAIAALAAEPALWEGGDAIDDGKTARVDLGPGVNAATGAVPPPPSTQGDERGWAEIIRNDYDRAPDHFAATDTWNDGADDIAAKIEAAIRQARDEATRAENERLYYGEIFMPNDEP